MDYDLFDPQLVIDRLVEKVPELKVVEGAADLAAAAESGVRQFPCAFVIPLADSPSELELATGSTQQRLSSQLGVIMVVRNLRDARGQNALVDLTVLRKLVHEAIYGWTPDAQVFDPLTRGGGRILQLDNQTLWWQDDYATASYLRSA